MEFKQLLKLVGREPLFETGLLLAGDVESGQIRRQLGRWVKGDKVFQLRRGLYTLAPPYQSTPPHPFQIANRLVRGSYVSLQSALSFAGLIPEAVPVTTSVTTARPNRWETPLGVFDFRHIQVDLFYGYRNVEVGRGQSAFVARPEKALLDLVYLTPGADAPEYLRELRLQNLQTLDLEALKDLANQTGKPKLKRTVALIAELAQEEAETYEDL